MVNKSKYQLDDLLANCDSLSSMPHELLVWERMKPVGKEFGCASGILKNIKPDSSVSDEESLQNHFE